MEHLGYARLDTDRRQRTGDPEVVLGTGKTSEQVVALLRALAQAHPDRAVLATRVAADALAAVRDELPEAAIDEVARTASLGPLPPPQGRVCVVTAGTSDLPVAREAAVTAAVYGAGVQVIGDVGVAGLHRLLAVQDDLARADCLVVVAGMEGALPSVVGGLVGVPLVAVPTSVGYGASFGGMAALLAMLNSCAPGVSVVNIDNGFGAGVFAARVARSARATAGAPSRPEPTAEPPGMPPVPAAVPAPVPAAAPAPVPAPGARTRVGWLDTASGVSGDMLLGALVDAGVPLQRLQDAVDAVVPGQVLLRAEPVTRAGLRAVRVHVDIAEPAGQRAWAAVRGLLEHADGLDEATRAQALATFATLAAAEAHVHGIEPDDVHFHEVGALDAIADVVGVCAGLQHLGLDTLTCSPVAVGGGTVATAHGRLPVPVPAVAALLTGVPTTGGAVDSELATPTGAALLRQAVTGYGRQPAMSVDRVGTGAGSRDHAAAPNVVRLLLGSPALTTTAATGRPLLLQTNVDDLDPRLWPDVLGRLLEVGASDAWLTPILMKKGRPAHTLSILVRPALRERVERVVFEETTTIGLRVQEVDKVALDRGELVVVVDGNPVRVKTATRDGEVVNRQPEHADVVAAARASGRSVKDVLAEAAAAARSVESRD